MRRAVRGCVERVLRCDVRCGLWRASAGCRAGGLRASCAMRLRILKKSGVQKSLLRDGGVPEPAQWLPILLQTYNQHRHR